MKNSIDAPKKVFFGTLKETNEKIYLSCPTWDCDWYWGFGYLGNNHCHYHLSGCNEGKNINMYDALIADYDLNPKITNKLWEFCEIVSTVYSLKETAEVLGRGGSHFTTNPFKDLIINKEEVNRINEELIPKLSQHLMDMFK